MVLPPVVGVGGVQKAVEAETAKVTLDKTIAKERQNSVLEVRVRHASKRANSGETYRPATLRRAGDVHRILERSRDDPERGTRG